MKSTRRSVKLLLAPKCFLSSKIISTVIVIIVIIPVLVGCWTLPFAARNYNHPQHWNPCRWRASIGKNPLFFSNFQLLQALQPTTFVTAVTAFVMAPSAKRRLQQQQPPSVVTREISTKCMKDVANHAEQKPSAAVKMPAIKTTTSSQNHQESSKLQEWMQHSHADYHNFSEQEAIEIRSALLMWYTANRRKLPWRGDPPPFDGSTSGIINNKSNSKRSNTKTADTKQKSITSFFSNATSTAKIKDTEENPSKRQKVSKEEGNSDSSDLILITEAIPVTGYGVWVSEIMLQQTRVEAVIPYWIRWMTSFPTVHDLAQATEEQVNAHWAGLGFYRRARLLHQGAKYVVNELHGNLPTTPEELSKLPGIGPYTAAAIASIAYDVCVPVVDGNVCRVLSRLTGVANHIKHPILKDKLGWKLAAQIVQAGDQSSPGLVNQALMELGATYCAPGGSGIDDRDPLKEYYLSTKLGREMLTMVQQQSSNVWGLEASVTTPTESCQLCDPLGRVMVLQQLQERISKTTSLEEAAKIGHSVLPTDPPKLDKREEDLVVGVVSIDDVKNNCRRYLMVKRPSTGLLAGQWEFPNVCIQIRNNKDKKKVSTKPPTKANRKRALTAYLLDDLFDTYNSTELVAAVSQTPRHVVPEPMDHIFSHIRHIMWLESGYLPVSLDKGSPLEWTSTSGKQVRWMNAADMEEVGITSGVKKVLIAINEKAKEEAKIQKKKPTR